MMVGFERSERHSRKDCAAWVAARCEILFVGSATAVGRHVEPLNWYGLCKTNAIRGISETKQTNLKGAPYWSIPVNHLATDGTLPALMELGGVRTDS